MDEFMETRIDVSCPECGGVMYPTLENVQMQRVIQCPNGHQVRLGDEGGGAQRLDAEIEQLNRQLRRLGGKFTIKF